MRVMEGSRPSEFALLRAINERVAEFARSYHEEEGVYNFLCECGDLSCAENVRLTASAYIEWADQGLVVAEGHAADS